MSRLLKFAVQLCFSAFLAFWVAGFVWLALGMIAGIGQFADWLFRIGWDLENGHTFSLSHWSSHPAGAELRLAVWLAIWTLLTAKLWQITSAANTGGTAVRTMSAIQRAPKGFSNGELSDGTKIVFDPRQTNINEVQKYADHGDLWKMTGETAPREVIERTKRDLQRIHETWERPTTVDALALDGETLGALVEIGGFHYEAGLREFDAWSEKLLEETGEWSRPYLQQTYKAVRGTLSNLELPAIGITDIDRVSLSPQKNRHNHPHPALATLLDRQGQSPEEILGNLVAGVDFPSDLENPDLAVQMFDPKSLGMVPTWFPREITLHRSTAREQTVRLTDQHRLVWFDEALKYYAPGEWPPEGDLNSKKRQIARSLLRMLYVVESDQIPTSLLLE